jgi:hypothetical protein
VVPMLTHRKSALYLQEAHGKKLLLTLDQCSRAVKMPSEAPWGHICSSGCGTCNRTAHGLGVRRCASRLETGFDEIQGVSDEDAHSA